MPISIRQIGEYLASGELKTISTDALFFPTAADPSHDGATLQIDTGGRVTAVHVPVADKEWISADVTDIPVTSTPAQLGSVTIDEDIPAGTGAFGLTGRLDNFVNQDRTVFIYARVNGVQVGDPIPINLNKNEVNVPIMASGYITGTVLNGDVISVWADSVATGVSVMGSILATTWKVQKAL